MKAALVSHNYNPGHYSHLLANGKLLDEAGISVRYYWHRQFNHPKRRPFEQIITFKDLRLFDENDFFIVWFPSLRALWEMLYIRAFGSAQIIYVLHEPFDSIQAYLAAGFGWMKTFKVSLISVVNYLLVSLAHKTILPSENAYSSFKNKYRYKKPFIKIPLLFDDELSNGKAEQKRLYMAYIGTIAEDHAFDEYLKFVDHACRHNLFLDYVFLIATKSTLTTAQQAVVAPHIASQRVVVQQGTPLSNDEINHWYASSVVVWNAYKRSMQSGVLPKAYMFGTPILTSESNQSEFFTDRLHGVMIEKNYNHQNMALAIDNVIANFADYSKNCRAFFLSNFHYRSQASTFMSFITQPK